MGFSKNPVGFGVPRVGRGPLPWPPPARPNFLVASLPNPSSARDIVAVGSAAGGPGGGRRARARPATIVRAARLGVVSPPASSCSGAKDRDPRHMAFLATPRSRLHQCSLKSTSSERPPLGAYLRVAFSLRTLGRYPATPRPTSPLRPRELTPKPFPKLPPGQLDGQQAPPPRLAGPACAAIGHASRRQVRDGRIADFTTH